MKFHTANSLTSVMIIVERKSNKTTENAYNIPAVQSSVADERSFCGKKIYSPFSKGFEMEKNAGKLIIGIINRVPINLTSNQNGSKMDLDLAPPPPPSKGTRTYRQNFRFFFMGRYRAKSKLSK